MDAHVLRDAPGAVYEPVGVPYVPPGVRPGALRGCHVPPAIELRSGSGRAISEDDLAERSGRENSSEDLADASGRAVSSDDRARLNWGVVGWAPAHVDACAGL